MRYKANILNNADVHYRLIGENWCFIVSRDVKEVNPSEEDSTPVLFYSYFLFPVRKPSLGVLQKGPIYINNNPTSYPLLTPYPVHYPTNHLINQMRTLKQKWTIYPIQNPSQLVKPTLSYYRTVWHPFKRSRGGFNHNRPIETKTRASSPPTPFTCRSTLSRFKLFFYPLPLPLPVRPVNYLIFPFDTVLFDNTLCEDTTRGGTGPLIYTNCCLFPWWRENNYQ